MVIFFTSAVAEPISYLFGWSRGEAPETQTEMHASELRYHPDSPCTDKESASSSISKDAYETEASNETLSFPEGGREAIMTVVGAFLVDFAQSGITSCVGVLQAQ